MLRSLTEIRGYTVLDSGSEAVGSVKDFFFDDVAWIIRYLVVDIGVWLPGREVLISPVALGQPDWGGGVSLPVHLTKEQIEASPPISANKPISRQEEAELSGYYQWPNYWDDMSLFGGRAVGVDSRSHLEGKEQTAQPAAETAVAEKTIAGEKTGKPHLRSVAEVSGYNIEATDGDLGHVHDFIVDTETWTIRYLVIDTRNWWPGKKVLIFPMWVDQIHWEESRISVDMTRETIKDSPEFDPSTPVNRSYEGQLFDYYGRPKYW